MKKWLKECLIFAILFSISIFIYQRIFERYLDQRLFFHISSTLPLLYVFIKLAVIFSLAYLMRVGWSILKYRCLRRRHQYILIILYIVYMTYILFFKTVGIRGVELNPLSFMYEIYYGSISYPLMNIILFVPVGFFIKDFKQAFIPIILGLLTIEIVQYIGHLGIFDIGDSVANFIGVSSGYALTKLKIFQKLKHKLLE